MKFGSLQLSFRTILCSCFFKYCDKSIVPPLFVIFKNSLETGIFPSTWKNANIVPVHKKQEKTVIKNYRPISLLPIMEKLLEKCIYDSIYSYFEKNGLFSSSQSGFRKNDSCVSQLLAITHAIFSGFNSSPSRETSRIFLDISKAFDIILLLTHNREYCNAVSSVCRRLSYRIIFISLDFWTFII